MRLGGKKRNFDLHKKTSAFSSNWWLRQVGRRGNDSEFLLDIINEGRTVFSSGVKCAIGSDQKWCEALLQFDLPTQSTAGRWICCCADCLILWLMGDAEFSSLVLNLWHVGLSNSDLQLGNHDMNETYHVELASTQMFDKCLTWKLYFNFFSFVLELWWTFLVLFLHHYFKKRIVM